MKAPEYVQRALEIAMDAHAGQTDKSGRAYIHHPLAVAKLMEPGDWPGQATALLHDVIEDSNFWDGQKLRLLGGIPDEIVSAVEAITHRPHEPLAQYAKRVRKNPLALKVKLADVAHNSDPERMAMLDGPLRDRLTEKYARTLEYLKGPDAVSNVRPES